MKLLFDGFNIGETVSSQIVSIIKDNLLKGKLKPGDKLPTEKELMDQLGVSRTPVREAIKILEAIGVIEIKRGQGMFIAESSENIVLNPLIFSLLLHKNNIDQLIEFRQHFEILLMSMIVTKQEINIKKLEMIYESQKTRMNKHMSYEELIEIDLEFHYAILKETKNPFVIEIGRTVYEFIKPSMIHLKGPKSIERILATHQHRLKILRGEIPFDAVKEVQYMIKNNSEMIDLY